MHRPSFVNKLVHIIEAKDYGSAGIDGDSLDTSKIHRACFVIGFGAITGDSVLKFYAGATNGTKTTALAFNYRFGGGDYKATDADTLGSDTAVASTGLTLTAATFDHRMMTVEFNQEDLPAGKPFLTLEINSTATVMLVSSVGICTPLFGGQTAPAVI